jgi:hypothetical protein
MGGGGWWRLFRGGGGVEIRVEMTAVYIGICSYIRPAAHKALQKTKSGDFPVHEIHETINKRVILYLYVIYC